MEVEIVKFRGSIGKIYGRALVDGQVVAEGEFTISLVEKQNKVQIDPTATIHPSADLGKDVKIGANVIIGPDVKIGNGTIIEANSVVEKWTTIGENCHLHYGSIVGSATQDKKYQGERSFVEIGDRNIIREYVTINRATGKDQKTIIGNDNLFLTNVHIGHNCELGNGIIISNATGLSGHVIVDDEAVIAGMVGVTQFCRIGRLVMVGGYSKVNQDVPPFVLVEGNPANVRSINIVGIQRKNVEENSISAIKKAFRYLYRSKLNLTQALTEIENNLERTIEVQQLIDFLKVPTERGIARRAVNPRRAGHTQEEDKDE
ncbi:MAG TPA: acyl-[acyl-carrier-protein]--UDP-N-acetylglucosamine O-acyltransferase [Candidatus Margulisbacteria bacterium]|nr:acyl-[acyl-carrier-protein]--UDP-N-acetylglucosamine O-acyltransferase [Candidatus Margulisiibacteriota bacterium]